MSNRIDPAAIPSAVWYRTASKGSAIVPVEVTASGKGWIEIKTDTGAIQRTRTDGEAEFYHPTREEARKAVQERLHQDIIAAEKAFAVFLDREFPPDDNAATRALDEPR